MAAFQIVTWNPATQSTKRRVSNEETFDFQSIKIGSEGLEIKQIGTGASAAFDFSGRKITNIALPTLSTDAASKGYVDSSIQTVETALDARLDVIEGVGEGSIAKALQDAKDYADYKDGFVRSDFAAADQVILQEAKDYADAQDAIVRTEFAAADQWVTTMANAYADNQDNVVRSEFAAADQVILSEANVYADMAVAGEAAIRAAADQQLYADITAEAQARAAADQALQSEIDALEAMQGDYLKKDGSVSLTGDLHLGGNKITNLADGFAATDAVNKGQLDSAITAALSDVTTDQQALQAEIDALEVELAAEESARIAADAAITTRLTAAEAAIPAAEAAAKAYADVAIASAVATEEAARIAADSALDSRISSLESDIASEIVVRAAADDALDARLDIIEGGPTVPGSISKAQADAQAFATSYVNTAIATVTATTNDLDSRLDVIEGTGPGSISKAQADAEMYAQSLVATEAATRLAEDQAIDGRLDVIEGTGPGSIAKAQADAEMYAQSLVATEAAARIAADNYLQDAINAVSTGLSWRPQVKAATEDADLVAAANGTALSTLLPFSDDETPAMTVASFVAGDYLLAKDGASSKLFRVIDDAGTLKVTAEGVTPLAAGQVFLVVNDLPDSPAGREGLSIYAYNTDLVKVGDLDWDLATGIDLSSSFTPAVGIVAAGDSIESAISKIVANLEAIDLTPYLKLDGSRQMMASLEFAADPTTSEYVYQIKGLAAGTAAHHAVTKGQLDSAVSSLQSELDAEVLALENEDLTFLKLDGSRSMMSDLDMDGYKVKFVGTPMAEGDAANKLYVDTATAKTATFQNSDTANISVRDIVYIGSDGTVKKAKSDTMDLNTYQIGIAADPISILGTGLVTIVTGAIVGGFTGLTAGGRVFVGRTAGSYAQDLSFYMNGEHVYKVGVAISSTEILFDPEHIIEL